MGEPKKFRRALNDKLGLSKYTNQGVAEEIFNPDMYEVKDGKLYYKESGELVKMPKKAVKEKLKVRGVDAQKLPQGRIKSYKTGGAFNKLSSSIQKSGKSKESADAIAYSIGVKKYGKAGMAAKAAAGRSSNK
jgi:hypothetical protein